MTPPVERTDLDRRIWDEELEEFVPRKVFDAHTHIFRWAHYLDPAKDSGPYYQFAGTTWAEATWKLADAVDAALMPGRTVHRLAFPFPFPHPCDFEASDSHTLDVSYHTFGSPRSCFAARSMAHAE